MFKEICYKYICLKSINHFEAIRARIVLKKGIMLLSCPESGCDFEVSEEFHMQLHTKLNHSSFNSDVAQSSILQLLDQLVLGMKPLDMKIDWVQMLRDPGAHPHSNLEINLFPHSNRMNKGVESSEVNDGF